MPSLHQSVYALSLQVMPESVVNELHEDTFKIKMLKTRRKHHQFDNTCAAHAHNYHCDNKIRRKRHTFQLDTGDRHSFIKMNDAFICIGGFNIHVSCVIL